MGQACRIGMVAITLLVTSVAAAAETDAATTGRDTSTAQVANPEDESGAGGEDTSYSHLFQFGLRASLVIPYRMVFRYDESPWCNEQDVTEAVAYDDRKKFCGFGGPLAVDLGASFAPLGSIEPFLWARFGLAAEAETNTSPVKILGAGVRIYTMSDSAFKVFIEPALGYEFEGGAGNDGWTQPGGEPFEYEQDLVLHLGVGPQIDVASGFGIFFNGGITVGMLRAIHSSLELQLGVQARLP